MSGTALNNGSTGKRKRTATRLPAGFLDVDEAVLISEAARKRRKRPAVGKPVTAAAAEDSDPDSSQEPPASSHHSVTDESESEEGEDAFSNSADEDERDQQQQAATPLDAPLSRKSLQKLNKKVSATLAPKTQSNYANYITVFKRWIAANGYTASGSSKSSSSSSKSKACVPDLGTMDQQKVVNLCYRFFDWWIVQGRPGDADVGGRLVPAGEYGRSTAMKLHSALQDHLDGERRAAGKGTFVLNQTPPYDGLYKVYCSKKRDRILVKAVVEGSNKAIVHMSFGRDASLQAGLRQARGCLHPQHVHSSGGHGGTRR
eukprot:GHUV01010395.1.p1 GENE.GHUV01010395.1~~GHUV01010395.1.p1  ORF type:complete len:316 (+),score=110.84 GHUV01010395.1:425-1372(+)